MYWQLHAALGLEALVAGKGPAIIIKHEMIHKYIFLKQLLTFTRLRQP
jgi:hypothetical protein